MSDAAADSSAHPEDDALIAEERPDGIVLRASGASNGRRVLLVHGYGMAGAWRRRRHEAYPSQHLWGCLELAHRGWEVLLPEPPPPGPLAARRKAIARRALPLALRNLGRGDVVYGTPGPWLTRLRRLGALRCSLVLLHHASTVPAWSSGVDAAVAIIPAAERTAHQRIRGPVARIDWGMEVSFYRPEPYRPRFALVCGKVRRDFDVLARAFADPPLPLRIVTSVDQKIPPLPPAVEVFNDRPGDESVSYEALRDVFYRDAAVAIIPLASDSAVEAFGITSLLEAMALARPVVLTRTRTLHELIDVEGTGIGLYVEPGDAVGMRAAVQRLVDDPDGAAAMGLRGRAWVERHFNLERMAEELDALFREIAPRNP